MPRRDGAMAPGANVIPSVTDCRRRRRLALSLAVGMCYMLTASSRRGWLFLVLGRLARWCADWHAPRPQRRDGFDNGSDNGSDDGATMAAAAALRRSTTPPAAVLASLRRSRAWPWARRTKRPTARSRSWSGASSPRVRRCSSGCLVLRSAAEENGVSMLREGGHRPRDARAFLSVCGNE